ncbi:hypothetical protein HPP92_002425 [Vanilla planifolia]|uniref:BHLH domain-containing protein n=1 Tax=Vanilla planifolia TaxID=51239 RepID=A0A835SEN5_VANPL|nr:hypothetical protein HPP92_002772 [Vanilla planifolia]KAG0502353.1 hypothetical protein HPP92_002425 [Vanilla planifolia]
MPNSNGTKLQERIIKEKCTRNKALKGNKTKCGKRLGEEEACREIDHELHIWTERERRKKMRSMFTNLYALLPHLPSKADKSTIVDEAVSYIRSLQQTLQHLEEQKLERIHRKDSSFLQHSSVSLSSVSLSSREAYMADQCKNQSPSTNSSTAVSIAHLPACFQTWTSPNVVLNIAGQDAHISICSLKKPKFLSAMFCLLEKHELEVVSLQFSSDCFRVMCMIHAHVSQPILATDQFPETLMIEDIYKEAVGEMILWLSS